MLDEEVQLAQKFRKSVTLILTFQLAVFIYSIITAAITGIWTGTWYLGIIGLIVVFLGLHGAKKRSPGLLMFYMVIMSVYAVWNAIYIILLALYIPALESCKNDDDDDCENDTDVSWDTIIILNVIAIVLSAIFWLLVVSSIRAASRLHRVVKSMEYSRLNQPHHNEHVVIITSNPQPQPTTVVYQPYNNQPYAPQPYPQTQPYGAQPYPQGQPYNAQPQGQPYNGQPYAPQPQGYGTLPPVPSNQPGYPSGPYYDPNAPN